MVVNETVGGILNGTVNETINAVVNGTVNETAKGIINGLNGIAANNKIAASISQFSNTSAVSFALDYGKQLPSLAMAGDFFALVLFFIFGFFLLMLINKFTGMILHIIKNTMVFIITGFGVYYFYREFMSRAGAGLTTETLLFGLVGAIIGLFGIAFAFYSFILKIKQDTRKKLAEEMGVQVTRDRVAVEKALPQLEAAEESGGIGGLRDAFSWESVKADKSLLSVLAFMMVAQFGVFSSKTIAAPNTQIGLSLFIAFSVGAFLFIKQSYKKYTTGVMHLLFTLVIGFALSVFLGSVWNEIPIGELISLAYFKTESLIALISGMALSLFAGSKS